MTTIQHFISSSLKGLSELYPQGEARSILYLLLEERLKLSKTELLLLDKDTALSPEDTEILQADLTRLLQEEPIQYILGYAYFFNEKIKVTPQTLIPRPETEELIIYIKEHLQKDTYPHRLKAIDLGTGSGCIPIGLATILGENTLSQIDAVDISYEALAVAKANIENIQAQRHKINFNIIQGDLLGEEHICQETYDLIVSNPPYIAPYESKDMSPHVMKWEPHIALFAPSEDPIIFYSAIARIAGNYLLNKGGNIFVEINPLYAQETLQSMTTILSQTQTIKIAKILKDLSGKDRFIHIQID